MSKQTFHKVGRRAWEWRLTPNGKQPRQRGRVPGTKRHWLKWRDVHNVKSLQRERVLADKLPLWWTIGLVSLVSVTPFLPNTMISVVSIFCIYASINVLWTLIVGTAGIFSLATLAVVGVAGYVSAAFNVYLGVPWPLMFFIGLLVGLAFGALLAGPATRLDGLYYALLTMGVVEICRVFVVQLRALTASGGAITNVDSFIPEDWFLQRPGLLLGFAGTFLLLLGSLLVWRLVNSERLGMLLRVAKASREDEAFAEAIGIDFRRARLMVFMISSASLGVVGAFYAMYFRSISPQIFSLDQMLLLFAMMVIGGLGRAEGAVVGAAIVTVIDKGLIELGQPRIILVALCMIFITVFAREGITGAREQFQDFRKRKQGEARARRTEKGGEAMPEEAAEVADKQALYYRRFNKRLRDRLKLLITPELIAEHQDDPLGHHSDQLARVLNYFRRAEMADKYVIHRLQPAEEKFRIMAVSGERGSPPRVVDDREYTDINEAYHAVFLLRVNDLMES